MVVYLITNLINNKKYIGADSNNDPLYLGSGIFIKKALKKYGRENFKKDILQECVDKYELYNAERYWISYFGAVNNREFYNIHDGGQGGDIRIFLNNSQIEEWKANISLGKAGQRKGIPLSEKNREGISRGLKIFHENNISPNTGRKHSLETRQKISNALKGREFSEEHKENMRTKPLINNESTISRELRDRLSKHNASLSAEEVILIYHLSKTKQKSYSELKIMFGISISCISEIVNKKTYKWVWESNTDI